MLARIKLPGPGGAEVMGGGVKKHEGAYRSRSRPALTLGLARQKDQTLDDGQYWATDFGFTAGRFALSGERVSYPGDEPLFVGQDKIYRIGILDPFSRITWTNTTPYSLTASFMVVPEKLELAVRIEDLDDANNTTRMGFGANRYVDGHDLKWQASLFKVDTDLPLLRSELLMFGLVFSF